MEIKSPHIVFEIPEIYPEAETLATQGRLKDLGYRVELKKSPNPEIMAALEWALPTAFAVYLLKPYFDGLLQEAGKDHYSVLKKSVTDFIISKRAITTRLVAASTSPNKLSKGYDQSLTVKLHAVIHENVKVSVLVNQDVSESILLIALNNAMDELLRLTKEFKDQIESPESHVSVELFMIMNLELQTWELLDKRQMIERYRTN